MCIFFFFGNLFCYLSTFSEYVNRCHEGFSLEALSVVQFYNCLWIHTTCVGIRAKCFGVHKKGHGGFSLETLSAVQFYNCFRIHKKCVGIRGTCFGVCKKVPRRLLTWNPTVQLFDYRSPQDARIQPRRLLTWNPISSVQLFDYRSPLDARIQPRRLLTWNPISSVVRL